MATIEAVVTSVVWSWSYTEVLGPPLGRLVQRPGYSAAVSQVGGDWQLPWVQELASGHWSRFWANYLGGPERLRGISSDAAWDRLVPLRWKDAWRCQSPAGTQVTLQALLHPAAVSVVATILAEGSWSIEQLAGAMADLRKAAAYGRDSPIAIANRNLNGLAVELRDAVKNGLSTGPPLGAPTLSSSSSVTAVLSGTGAPEAFKLDAPGVAPCVAGLAGLGPPGPLIAANLLPENSNTNRSARIYCIGDGHAIWKTDAIGGGTLTGAVDCLQRNHTAVVAQIAGLGGMVNWAADRVARHLPVDVAVQPVLERALRILYRLHDGQKTYRSEVAKARVAPILADMDAIKVATGLGAP